LLSVVPSLACVGDNEIASEEIKDRHDAAEPNAVINLIDAESLASQLGGDVDPLTMQRRRGGAPTF